ncbi:hypothetical protein DL93DRAFT_2158029 [Clavulina sp. PMI_390]|nr:hypothetical protein DL93DRAFT_2158029 [Clavulina sp. PMI_390]
MPHFFSAVLHQLANFLWPGPPASMDSPIPLILMAPQYVAAIAKAIISDAITDGDGTTSPNFYARHTLSRIAVTRSEKVLGVYHQSLVLEFEEFLSSSKSIFHILVAERRTSPNDAPHNINDIPGNDGNRPTRNLSKQSSDATSDFLFPHGNGRDTIRYWAKHGTREPSFWSRTKGDPSSDFKAENAVVFDFSDSGATQPLTLHEVILSMRAVSLVAPKYEFTTENCWWWAQSVILLLLQLRSQNQNLTLPEIERREKFFEKVDNPKIVVNLPKAVGITSTINHKLILKDAGKAYENYLDLKSKADAALERYEARARLPHELRKTQQKLDAETERADTETERADANAREASRANAEATRTKQENETLRALLKEHGVNSFD